MVKAQEDAELTSGDDGDGDGSAGEGGDSMSDVGSSDSSSSHVDVNLVTDGARHEADVRGSGGCSGGGGIDAGNRDGAENALVGKCADDDSSDDDGEVRQVDCAQLDTRGVSFSFLLSMYFTATRWRIS
jgi:hypothetical protein